MNRQLTASSLAFFLTLTLVAGTAFAAPGHYRAEPATQPAASKLVVNGIVWKCGASGCIAPRGTSRPAIDCSALAREVGALRRFAVGEEALGPAELEKCNSRAR